MRSKPSELFSAFLGERLETLRFATVAALKKVISIAPPADVASVGFAILDGPTEQFPIVAFAWDTNGMPLTRTNSAYISEVCDTFRVLPPLFSEQEEDQFVAWETIDGDGPVHALEQPMDGWEETIFIPWFSECWKRAGGAGFARPATVELHTDTRITLN